MMDNVSWSIHQVALVCVAGGVVVSTMWMFAASVFSGGRVSSAAAGHQPGQQPHPYLHLLLTGQCGGV